VDLKKYVLVLLNCGNRN